MIAGVLSSHSILLENAPLITFFTFSPPQALEQPDHFHAGGARKKRSLVRCKSVKSCARPYPPCEAQPRRVALMLRLAAAEQSACLPWHATAKASLQNHFDGEMKLEMLARHRLLNKQVHVPAVTAAHLNAAAVSNTAIAPSSSLLPPLSSRRSAGARRVATAARAAAAVALSPTQCHFCRRGSAALPPGIRTRVRSENCLCVLRAHSSLAQAKFSFPVADCQSRAFGSF